MGLLDDAIREHLELKRLRGADPGDVARSEQEALGPVERTEAAEREPLASGGSEPAAGAQHPAESFGDASVSGDAHEGGYETVELDMGSVLEDERADAASGYAPEDRDEDSLDWEMPDSATRSAGHEETRPEDEAEPDAPVEDVLEETPDFLRETPEQERLWFEQRPPRDFDFNE